VVFRHQSGREANWGVEALTSHCAECDRLAKRIARRYSIRFDLRDATQHAVGTDACSPEVVAAQ
jgi:hypothetical protein